MLWEAIQDLYNVSRLYMHTAVSKYIAKLSQFIVARLLLASEGVHSQNLNYNLGSIC